jgi:1,6-anhydro-N-acetylmuramate kinase
MNSITIKLRPAPILAIGLMSGTSHDGVSAALGKLTLPPSNSSP